MDEPLIYRSKVLTVMGCFGDIRFELERLNDAVLGGEDDGDEATEDDE